MQIQRSQHHFEFFGIDIIADVSGASWLIEINRYLQLKPMSTYIFYLYSTSSFRLPGLESSSNNKAAEDAFYDEMMHELLSIVLQPLRSDADDEASAAATLRSWVQVNHGVQQEPATIEDGDSNGTSNHLKHGDFALPACHFNTLRWKLLTRQLRGKVMVSL